MIYKHILILLALALLATVGADGGEGDETPSSTYSNKKLRGVISLVSSSSGAASGVGAGEMKPAAIGTKDDRPAAVYDNSQGASTQRDGRVFVDRDYYTVSDSSSGSSKATGRVDKDYEEKITINHFVMMRPVVSIVTCIAYGPTKRILLQCQR
jgi:hypothetical protein